MMREIDLRLVSLLLSTMVPDVTPLYVSQLHHMVQTDTCMCTIMGIGIYYIRTLIQSILYATILILITVLCTERSHTHTHARIVKFPYQSNRDEIGAGVLYNGHSIITGV